MIKALHKIIRPFMMRRLKKEALKSIPPKKEIHIYVKMSDLQLDLYKKILLKKPIGN